MSQYDDDDDQGPLLDEVVERNSYGGPGQTFGQGPTVYENEQTYCQRLGASICGMGIGLILFFLALVMLFWNEGNAVKTAKAIAEGERICIDVRCAPVDPANEGRLVHAACPLTQLQKFADGDLDVHFEGLSFSRTVEMYQWVESKHCETEHTSHGGTREVCTYSYSAEWSSTAHDSTFYQYSREYHNPTRAVSEWPTQSRTIYAEDVRMGDFSLAPKLVAMMNAPSYVLPLADHSEFQQGGVVPRQVTPYNTRRCPGNYYETGPCNAPRIGDIRIQYRGAAAQAASVIGKQTSDTFTKWRTKAGRAFDPVVKYGIVDKEEYVGRMFEELTANLHAMTWMLRAIGFLLCWVSFMMLSGPLQILPDIIPGCGTCLGGMVGNVLCCATFGLAASISLTTMSIAWIFYRPIVGIPLLLLGVGGLVWYFYFRQQAAPLPEKGYNPYAGHQQQAQGQGQPYYPPYQQHQQPAYQPPMFGQPQQQPPPYPGMPQPQIPGYPPPPPQGYQAPYPPQPPPHQGAGQPYYPPQ